MRRRAGLIDPHEHLLGGSGEKGFSSQTPEIFLDEIVSGGITTVVGCLGVDTTMKTLPGLLARAKGLTEEGITAFIWTGGYNVPPTSMLGSVRDDILFIAEVIGVGEVAIADERSTDPRAQELARLVNDAYVGGLLSNKAGVTHFHVGERQERLSLLRTLIDEYDVKPEWLYPTHVDTTDRRLAHWLGLYRDADGDLSRLTVSTDASVTSPGNLHDQLRACVVEHGWALEEVLPLVTTNTAGVLRLRGKGELAEGKDADVIVLDAASLEVREVIARGKRVVKGGRVAVASRQLQDSDRGVRVESAAHRVGV